MSLLLLSISGCSGDKYENKYENPWISIDESYKTLGAEGDVFYVHLEASHDWERRILYESSNEYDWVSVSQVFGFGGLSYDIKVTVDQNYDKKRTATVLFYLKGYGEQRELIIVQDGSSANGGSGSTQINAPSGLQASVSGYTINLSWNSVSRASYYNVYSTSSSGTPVYFMGKTANTSGYLTAYTTGYHYFVVTAVDSNGNESSYSNIASCTVSVAYNSGGGNSGGGNSGGGNSGGGNSGGGSGGNTSAKPSTPTGLKAVQSGETIVVTWNAVNNAYIYCLNYSTPSGTESYVNVYAPETSTVFSNNLKDGTYRFWIEALNSNYDASNASSKVSCTYKSSSGGNGGGKTQLDTPTNLEAYSSSSFVQISFNPVPAAYQYYLYRSTSPNSGYNKITASGGSSGSKYVLTDQNPKSGTTYYKVKAIALPSTGIKDSEFSAYVKVTR